MDIKRDNRKWTFIAGVIIIVGILAVALLVPEIPGRTGEGYLQGTVTIGPLCPVEPCHISEERQAAAYAARHLDITGTGFSGPAPEAGFTPDGKYRIALPAGDYDVSLPKNGIDHSADLPRRIVIRSGEATVLNVSIDTGIR